MIPGSLIVRYGEITLKGKNRIDFEKQNLKTGHRAPPEKIGRGLLGITVMRGRIYVHGLSSPADLRTVLGVYSFSPAREIARDYDEVEGDRPRHARRVRGPPVVPDLLPARGQGIFARLDGRGTGKSAISSAEETGIPVSLTDPELEHPDRNRPEPHLRFH